MAGPRVLGSSPAGALLPTARAAIEAPSEASPGAPGAPPGTAELLALLVGRGAGSAGAQGPRRERARAEAILAQRHLVELSRFSSARLVAELGLSDAAARRLAAAFELGRRVEAARRSPRASMRSPRQVFEAVRPRLRGLEQETFLVLLLDAKHALQRTVRVSEGTLTTSLVHPREVFAPALREAAAAVVVVHNHPSGDPEPSREDLEVTRRLAEVGRLLGIPLIDHVVVGEAGFVSLRERGQL